MHRKSSREENERDIVSNTFTDTDGHDGHGRTDTFRYVFFTVMNNKEEYNIVIIEKQSINHGRKQET